MKKEQVKSPIWCAVFTTTTWDCYHVEFGHEEGKAKIDLELAKLLTRNFYNKNKDKLKALFWLAPCSYGGRCYSEHKVIYDVEGVP